MPVYDDYAHHPTEVAAAIAAARTLAPGRLVAVFQPHLYSRTRALAREFGARAGGRRRRGRSVDVYPARERAEDFPGVDGRLVAAAAADAAGGRQVAWLPSFEDARRFLLDGLRAGDLCLVMGAGDIDALGRSLVVAQGAASACRAASRRSASPGRLLPCSRMSKLPGASSGTTRSRG